MTEPITLCELELPKEYKPGTIVEHFKRQHSLTQDEIKNKKYPQSVLNYTGDILMVGINYDKENKEHQCLIEKYEKE